MANTILTAPQITQHALGILEKEFDKAYSSSTPYCLVQVSLKDGSTHELMMRLHPYNLYEMGEEMKKNGMLVMNNEENAILVMAADVKQITLTKVTKEQP
jgi:hypothetical protein